MYKRQQLGAIMALESKEKQKIIKKYGKNDKDTGATEVQVALLTSQIRSLTEHAKLNKNDKHSRSG